MLKNACYLSYYASLKAPNLLFGSLQSSFLMRSFAYFDMFVGVRRGPLNRHNFTFLYSKIKPLYCYYNTEGIQLLAHKKVSQVNTSLLFLSVLAFLRSKGPNKLPIRRNFLFYCYKFLLLRVQSLLIYNDLQNQAQHYQV